MAATLDLTIDQGADFSERVAYKINDLAVDLTGYNGRGQIRIKPSSPQVAAEFDIVFEEPRTSGVFYFELSADASSAMVVGDDINSSSNLFCYDIELVKPDNKVVRVLQGKIRMSPEVTKP